MNHYATDTRSFPAPPKMVLLTLALILVSSFAIACGEGGEQAGSGSDPITSSSCDRGNLETLKTGVLTVGAVEPLSEPYFEDGDPANGRGFLGSLGYELAAALGYDGSQVEWETDSTGTGRQGRTDFDLLLIPEEPDPAVRKRLEISQPYFEIPQAIVVAEGSDLAGTDSLDQLKGARIGVLRGSAGRRAVETVIKPARRPRQFGDGDRLLQALGAGKLDVGVVGLPDGLEGIEAVPGLEIAGQFPFAGGGAWSVLLPRKSALAGCVDDAIGRLSGEGILGELARQWMGDAIEVPQID